MATLAIIGAGTLGRSLAAWAALRGFEVRLAGRDGTPPMPGLEAITVHWEAAVRTGRLTREEQDSGLTKLRAASTWAGALEGADIVLEALPEDPEVKTTAWRDLHGLASSQVLRLSGSSSLPIATLAEAADMSGQLLGFHLFVPVERMHLVELVVPEGSHGSAVEKARAFGTALGLSIVKVRDQPGYAASRMALAQGLEAMRLLEAGVASAEGLDTLMVKGYGHPIGPLALSDLIGLDLRLTIAEGIFQAHGDARFQPPSNLRKLVAMGHTGRKAGQGFFSWNPSEGQS